MFTLRYTMDIRKHLVALMISYYPLYTMSVCHMPVLTYIKTV